MGNPRLLSFGMKAESMRITIWKWIRNLLLLPIEMGGVVIPTEDEFRGAKRIENAEHFPPAQFGGRVL